MAVTIQDFLVGLGFKIDADGLRRFHEGINNSTKLVRDFALSVTGMAVAAEEAIRRTSRNFENLYYVSQRIGTSVRELQATRFAFRQVGLDADAMTGTLQRIASNFRDNPAFRHIANIFAPGFTRPEQVIEGFAKRYRALEQQLGANSPAFESAAIPLRRFAEMLGASAEDILQLSRNLPVYRAELDKARQIYALFGLDNDKAAKQAVAAQNAIRTAWLYLETGFNTFITKTFPLLEDLLKEFALWMAGPGATMIGAWAREFDEWLKKEDRVKQFTTTLHGVLDVTKSIATAVTTIKTALEWIADHPKLTSMLGGAAVGSRFGIGGTIVGGFIGGATAEASGARDMPGFQFLGDRNPAPGKGPYSGGNQWWWNTIKELFAPPLTTAPVPPPSNSGGGGRRSSLQGGFTHASFGGFAGSDEPVEKLIRGFGNWWSGSSQFRPVVVIADEFYQKFGNMLEMFGMGGGGAAGGGGGGVGGISGRAGGRFSSTGPARGGGGGGGWSPGQSIRSGTGMGHVAERSERVAFYRQYALSKGIDPDSVTGTIAGEGLNSYTGDRGTSFGDFQLHVGGGMGDAAVRAGINIRDPNTWREQGKFAIDQMAANKGKPGWFAGQWHGAPGWAAQRYSAPSSTADLPGGAPGRGTGRQSGIGWAAGDSIAEGLARYGGVQNAGIGGQTPRQIHNRIMGRLNDFAGQSVALALGSNPNIVGGFSSEQQEYARKTVQALQKVGAKVVMLGVGKGVHEFAQRNQRLGDIAKEFGIPFTGALSDTEGKVHPSPRGYIDNLDAAQRALGASGAKDRNLNLNHEQKTDIHLHGTDNSAVAARAVRDVIDRQWALNMRTWQTQMA